MIFWWSLKRELILERTKGFLRRKYGHTFCLKGPRINAFLHDIWRKSQISFLQHKERSTRNDLTAPYFFEKRHNNKCQICRLQDHVYQNGPCQYVPFRPDLFRPLKFDERRTYKFGTSSKVRKKSGHYDCNNLIWSFQLSMHYGLIDVRCTLD